MSRAHQPQQCKLNVILAGDRFLLSNSILGFMKLGRVQTQAFELKNSLIQMTEFKFKFKGSLILNVMIMLP